MAQAIEYSASPTGAAFHKSNKFIRCMLGPVGSGKSVTCIMEMLQRAIQQAPYNGIRKSRHAIIRNSYPELKTTTLATFSDWIPFAKINWQPPIKASIFIKDIGDGTSLDAEFLFLALDRPQDSKKLLSLELTTAFINECREIPKDILDVLTGRVGRFPSVREGGATWSGIIMDSNPPSTDSWIYRIFEEEKPDDWVLFKQPAGLLLKGVDYVPNPDAENIQYLPNGHEYYMRQLSGKSANWIKSYILGQYADNMDGKPIYAEWNDDLHISESEINPIRGLPVYVGLDFGLTPAAAFAQITSRGQLIVLDELVSEDMGIRSFTESLMQPLLNTKYKDCPLEVFGDPAGVKRSDTDERTVFQELLSMGIYAQPTETNSPLARWEAVKFWLNKMVDGKPAIQVDARCHNLRKGFNGGYRFKRLQTSGERYADKADKNEYSHLADAFQYLCQGIKSDKPKKQIPIVSTMIIDSSVGY